ncbi:hypothetical protein HOP50_20g85540 [Chloropicon primus]|uniref:Uncharacterized protein n=1 Tax=Chloropicon primus TaxID=1764295 RepID=A0A5B8MZK3_9CHLO|nr:hypothetical protein A3770_20p85210 [Chloropicon primus]UPR05204.1 hypothetical protein HOP50_20g85540 [Chloropicon primus]|eukprot:QDZ26003.1 hypothetical protein A3770_20p85210 [Chloropicon primus]
MAGKCSLFGAFGWFVQGILFFTAGMPLLWKWYNEKPRRTFVTLVLDSIKQVAGNIGVHFINLALSATFANLIKPVDSCGDEECLWYFLNFMIDVFLGVPLNYCVLKALKSLAERRKWTLIQGFGDYKDKDIEEGGSASSNSRENLSLKRIGAQTMAWLGVVACGKMILCILILSQANNLLLMSANLLAGVRCHSGTSSTVELLVVMLLIPTCLNALQFWVTDSFIKFSTVKEKDGPGSGSGAEVNLLQGQTNFQPGSPKHEKSPLIKKTMMSSSRID